MYIADEKGKWKIEGNVKMLIEPSESYLVERDTQAQAQMEQELLESLKPSQKEVLMAEIQLDVITLLLDLEVI